MCMLRCRRPVTTRCRFTRYLGASWPTTSPHRLAGCDEIDRRRGCRGHRGPPMITCMEDGSVGVIGRDPELAAVATFVAGLGREFAQVTLEGEAGIGKTTLWREALRRASAGGAQVLVTRPGESEATLSFAALGDLFESVDEGTMDRLPIPQREAISAALLRHLDSGPQH